MIKSYVAVDIETTGLHPKEDKIIEIGAIKVVDGVKVDTFESFINPHMRIPEFITGITGISNKDVENAPSDGEVIRDFIDFAEDFVLLGHNVRFDYSFIKVVTTNNKLDFDKECIDTLRIARKALPELPSRSLEILTEKFHINHDNKHRAFSDAEASSLLYQLFAEKYYEGNESSFEPLHYDLKFKKESAITPKQVKYLSDLVKRYNIELDQEIESMTKNSASRMIDRIRFEYANK